MSQPEARVIYFSGPYEGMEVDYVILCDPKYILWAAENVPNHGLSDDQVDRALRETEGDEDWSTFPDDTDDLVDVGFYEADRWVPSDER